MVNERTPLTEGAPSYIFPSRPPRIRERQLKQFQCCICCSLLTAVFLALIITITYTINTADDDASDGTKSIITTTNSPLSPSQIDDVITTLIAIDWPLLDEPQTNWENPMPNDKEQLEAIQAGKLALGDREMFEESMEPLAYNTPSFRAQRAVGTSLEARTIAKIGYVENHATTYLVKKHPKPSRNQRWTVGKGPSIGLHIPKKVAQCDFNSKYRTVNGTCNNKEHPNEFGVAMRPFRRVLNPDYADGVSAARRAHDGSELPSARQVSLEVHRPSYHSDYNFTVMLAVWGQFLDHDITATALNQGENGEPIECCKTKEIHPECLPVPIEKGDPYFDDYNATCLNFVRSIPAPTGTFGPRQQLNQATSFIDGSVVYGNTEDLMNSLRSGTGGKLRMFYTPDNRTLLPPSTDPTDGCNEKNMNAQGKYCFSTGDKRANENLLLTSMHLIFARHHNYLAENLEMINPHWTDDQLFFEARAILGAQMQHIHYDEFLSVLLGKEMTEKMGILSQPKLKDSPTDMYDPSIDPTIANNFAAAAFRFAHTLLPGLMRMTRDTTSPEAVRLHQMLFNPFSLYKEHGLNNAIKMAIYTPLEKNDPLFTPELTENLFQRGTNETLHDLVPEKTSDQPWKINPPPMCGLDLVSLNLQRGRDHGLPAYISFREHCKFPKIVDWTDFRKAVDPDSFVRIKSMYKNPEDVDLYTGALSEYPIHGGIVGPLLACLIGDQFVRMKYGDSHWYERQIGPQKFTDLQLDQIYNTTLSSIICINSDGIDQIPVQKYIMKHSGVDNPIEECGALSAFDFTPWIDDGVTNKLIHVHKLHTDEMQVKSMVKDNSTDNPTVELHIVN